MRLKNEEVAAYLAGFQESLLYNDANGWKSLDYEANFILFFHALETTTAPSLGLSI